MTDEFRTRLVGLLPRLRRFALALTGDLDQADDLVQEACMRALSRIAQWQPGTRLDSWMYRIAQNIWLDRVRARKVRGEGVGLEAAEITGAPIGTVMSRLARARRELHARLDASPVPSGRAASKGGVVQ